MRVAVDMTDVAKLQSYVSNGDEGDMDMLPDEDNDLDDDDDDDIPGLESVSSSDVSTRSRKVPVYLDSLFTLRTLERTTE